jgi:hypothetical protein
MRGSRPLPTRAALLTRLARAIRSARADPIPDQGLLTAVARSLTPDEAHAVIHWQAHAEDPPPDQWRSDSTGWYGSESGYTDARPQQRAPRPEMTALPRRAPRWDAVVGFSLIVGPFLAFVLLGACGFWE